MYIYIFIHIYIYIHIYIFIHIHVCVYIHTSIYTYTYIYIYTYVYIICMYEHIHIVFPYIPTYSIHVNTYSHLFRCRFAGWSKLFLNRTKRAGTATGHHRGFEIGRHNGDVLDVVHGADPKKRWF